MAPNHFLSLIALFFGLLALCGCDSNELAEVPSASKTDPGPATLEPPEAAPTPEPEPVAIAAWVDGEPIHVVAIDQEMSRLRMHYARNRRRYSEDLLEARRAGVLRDLIDKTLLRQRILKAGIEVNDAVVDAEVQTRVGEVFGSREALERHLAERGWTMQGYREELRLELGTRELLGSRVEPTDEQLHALYRRVANRPPVVDRVRAKSVIFPPDTPSAAVAAKMTSVQDERAFADLTDSGARELALAGWISRDSVDRRLAETLFAADVPGPTALIPTPSGVQVYWVTERVTEPTPHFRKLEPLLRERAASAELARHRAELVATLRDLAEIKIPANTAP